jgi:hypothetical protein
MKPSLMIIIVAIFQIMITPLWRKEAPAYGAAREDNQVSGSPTQTQLEGVQFVAGSNSQLILERGGKKYLIDAEKKTIQELGSQNITAAQPEASAARAPESIPPKAAEPKPSTPERDVYYVEDINLWTLPTTHPLDKHELLIDFTHRFSYDTTFTGPGRPAILFGLDGFSISSFGFTYGITDRFFGGVYRVPTALGRIIEFYGGAQLAQESKGQPFSTTFRVAVEGANHFTENYVTSLELAFAKSLKQWGQIYFVPTVSFNNRPMIDAFGNLPPLPGVTTTALGAGLSLNIRPSVAFITECNGRVSGELGTHRPAFMFGIQKKVFRHSFTLGVTNSPGTTLSQRSATRSSLQGSPDDSFGGLTLGFNLSRRLF